MGDHWAWSHVIQSLCGKTSDWLDYFKIRCHEIMFLSRFGCCSWEEVEKTIPLGSRGVRVLTKCSRRQIGFMAIQTILKVDKRPGKHISLQQRVDEEQWGDYNINHTNWYEDKSISSKDSQQTWQIRGSWA